MTEELTARLQAALGTAYAVDRTLGAGGFAVVYLVSDLNLKRKLAVKVLSPDLITSKTVLERFRREAETVAQLSHPNIVPLHFIGEHEDLLYLAMGYVDGGSLADRITREGRLPVRDARRAMEEVASALAHAHKRGVIHRDIKPQNVLLDSESGRCLVTDFGIARTADGGSLTATGMVVGTPAYLAPEQVTGEPSDHRADIFALGVMSYEMLAGRSPYEGATPTAVLMKRLAGPPEPLTKVRSDVPRELSEVVNGCLATDPAERFQSAGEVVRALGGVTSGSIATGEIASRMRGKRRSYRIAGIIGALVVAVGAVALLSRSAQRAGVAAAPVDSGMVLIPAGEYVVGSDLGAPSSRPAHRARLEAFGIDRFEVSVGDYRAFVDATSRPAPWAGTMPRATLPVTRASWSDATGYCAWKHPGGGRLPAEDEWEAAARGVQGRAYPWGERWENGRANTASARGPDGGSGLTDVGVHPLGATPEGVHDLIGNVWEWTTSPMRAYPGAPPMPDSMQQFRVIRGGAWNTREDLATASFRGYNRPATSPDELEVTGFRCAMKPRLAPGGR